MRITRDTSDFSAYGKIYDIQNARNDHYLCAAYNK